jgi:hypothetical protein
MSCLGGLAVRCDNSRDLDMGIGNNALCWGDCTMDAILSSHIHKAAARD